VRAPGENPTTVKKGKLAGKELPSSQQMQSRTVHNTGSKGQSLLMSNPAFNG